MTSYALNAHACMMFIIVLETQGGCLVQQLFLCRSKLGISVPGLTCFQSKPPLQNFHREWPSQAYRAIHSNEALHPFFCMGVTRPNIWIRTKGVIPSVGFLLTAGEKAVMANERLCNRVRSDCEVPIASRHARLFSCR